MTKVGAAVAAATRTNASVRKSSSSSPSWSSRTTTKLPSVTRTWQDLAVDLAPSDTVKSTV